MHTVSCYSNGFSFWLVLLPEQNVDVDDLPDFRGHAPPGDESSVVEVGTHVGNEMFRNTSDESIVLLNATSMPGFAQARLWVGASIGDLATDVVVEVAWPHLSLAASGTLDGRAMAAAQDECRRSAR